jgi:hypothetical protein
MTPRAHRYGAPVRPRAPLHACSFLVPDGAGCGTGPVIAVHGGRNT